MIEDPLALIAEITHRCPLHCVYCSNPEKLVATRAELSTEEWIRVFEEAADVGVLHLHLTGGEPAARSDLLELVSSARRVGLYSNLITSGIGLSEDRLVGLIEAGLDHIQLSFQDSREAPAQWIAGAKTHDYKVRLASTIRRCHVAFTVNIVVHRQNLDHLEEIISFAESLGPGRIEIAHVQYYGWALKNRAALLPTAEQLAQSQGIIESAQRRLSARIRIEYVIPDYYARFPKACMGGWGRRLMLIDPSGQVLPCHAAGVLPNMKFATVREHQLKWIWLESDAFRRFRGEAWMHEPCSSCERRDQDFGGCRCQAFLLTGDACLTDPVCSLSPNHQLIEIAKQNADSVPVRVPWLYRINPA